MLKQNIKKFIELEEISKEMNKKQRMLRDQKKRLEADIVNYLIKNNMAKSKLNLGSNTITLTDNYTSGNLSMSLVFDTLCDILKNKEKAQEICDTIQDIRDKNSKTYVGLRVKPRK